MSSSTSPCAACKFLRRKCTQGCVFAPYFPPDQPQKFANVHRVFGASNVAKLLNEIPPAQREDAVNSLAYEAEARLRDPVYGCVGYISILQHKLKQVQNDLYNAKKELSAYIGPAALGPLLPPPGQPHHPAALVAAPHQHPPYHHLQGASSSSAPPFGVAGMGFGMGLGLAAGAGTSAPPHHAQMLLREQQQQQQLAEAQAQQLAVAVAAAREQEMLRSYEQQQQELARFATGYTDVRGFPQMGAGATAAAGPSSGLALVPPQPIETPFLVHHQQPPQQYAEQTHQQQQAPPQHQIAGSDDGRAGIGPSFLKESGIGPSS